MTGVIGGALFAATLVCVAANAFEVAAKAVRAPFVLRNSAEVGVGRAWLPWLALLEGAGTAGLVVGLLGLPLVGLAAATGLVLFFVGAVTAHVRARVLHNIAFPGVFLGLAAAALAHFAGHVG
ncbi:DoxX family protein [Streptomonospora sp. S1-112]|uniref:DoxX family protein n=1 Tax=Streptomonospora mangrovi TaxID=2883123 RepID=A0A9X3NN15_9ACTN|nr:DoxX family protein [Streptomonospora mangrovi]MDA0566288.1 DoxX family protein [Streptomonospora mangrovi]